MQSNEELTAHIKALSEQKFGKAFTHAARWNNRLRSTGGRFFPRDSHLDFNPKMAELPEFDQIILHELVHYHLYQEKRGYKHGDADFKALLLTVGGARYAPSIVPPTYCYFCQKCGQVYRRQRKMDTHKYRCGRCHGKLGLRK